MHSSPNRARDRINDPIAKVHEGLRATRLSRLPHCNKILPPHERSPPSLNILKIPYHLTLLFVRLFPRCNPTRSGPINMNSVVEGLLSFTAHAGLKSLFPRTRSVCARPNICIDNGTEDASGRTAAQHPVVDAMAKTRADTLGSCRRARTKCRPDMPRNRSAVGARCVSGILVPIARARLRVATSDA